MTATRHLLTLAEEDAREDEYYAALAAITPDAVAVPGECPNCGGWHMAYEPADPSVGILADSHYCEDCGHEL